MQPADDAYDDHHGFWRPSTIAAGIILLLILLVAGLVIGIKVGGGHSHADTTPSPTVSSVPGSTSPGTAKTSSSGKTCNLPGGSQAVPDASPPGITWNIYDTVALPFSTQYGPEYVDGDVARCYAHNPIGALIAGTQIVSRLALASDWKAVLEQQVMPGEGMANYLAQQSSGSNVGSNQPGDYAQIAGFQIASYTSTTAVIDLVTRTPQGGLSVSTLTVDWYQGDWRLSLLPSGATNPPPTAISSLYGYITWGGV